MTDIPLWWRHHFIESGFQEAPKSKKMNLLELANHIIELAEVGDFSARRDTGIKTFGFGTDAINFVGERRHAYQEAAWRAYSQNEDVEQTYSFREFEKRFIGHFHSKLEKGERADSDDIERFESSLLEAPLQTYTVFRPIVGIRLEDQRTRLQLGSYEILHFPSHEDSLRETTDEFSRTFWEPEAPEYLIVWRSRARHYEKAVEMADVAFSRFEHVVRYLIGDHDRRFEVGVLNYEESRIHRSYVLDESGPVSQSTRRCGPYDVVALDDDFFSRSDRGHDQIWRISSGERANSFENRLSLAIEWIGQSMGERSTASGFLKAAISLEILFTYQPKGVVTPSIMNMISESVALILADGVSERVALEKKLKKLYGIRSAIAHAGKQDIDRAEYVAILDIARRVVTRLLTSQRLRSVKTIERFHELTKRNKYSGPAM